MLNHLYALSIKDGVMVSFIAGFFEPSKKLASSNLTIPGLVRYTSPSKEVFDHSLLQTP
jgi:hypothetical protein